MCVVFESELGKICGDFSSITKDFFRILSINLEMIPPKSLLDDVCVCELVGREEKFFRQ